MRPGDRVYFLSGRRDLARPRFGKELPLRFKPIGTGVPGKVESVSPLGNEIGARPDFLVTRLGT